VTPPLLRVFQAGGCFHVCWGYDGGRFHRQAVETWARDLVQELRALAVAADDAVDVEYVASDFPLANLDKRSLEQVAALLRDQDSAEGG
jgi:hypothetical protein